MAGTNDFLPIAGGVGANVISQVDFASLTTFLANGFQSGIVESDQFNKVIRQSSFISSCMAQIVAEAEVDALDDGDQSTFVTNFLEALASLGGRPGHTYTANDWAYIDKGDGLVIQWGTATTINGTGTWTYPTAFDTGALRVFASQDSTNSYVVSASPTSATTAAIASSFSSGSDSFYLFAIGRI